jgi:hypothetical protein
VLVSAEHDARIEADSERPATIAVDVCSGRGLSARSVGRLRSHRQDGPGVR